MTLGHGGGRVVSASGSETCVTSSMPTSAIIYDACTSIKKKIIIISDSGTALQRKKKKVHVHSFKFVLIIKKMSLFKSNLCLSCFFKKLKFHIRQWRNGLDEFVVL